MDVVDYIKQVKRKKLEKDLVVRETCTRFGLSVDEALVAFDELIERGILTTQEDSVVVDGKENIELTKNFFKAWQESSSRESTVACTQTLREEFPVDVKTTCTQTSAQEPPPSTPCLQHPSEPTHGDIYHSFALLAKSVVDLQYAIDKERDANRILLERNHQRETSDESAKILAEKSSKHDIEPDNKKVTKSEVYRLLSMKIYNPKQVTKAKI